MDKQQEVPNVFPPAASWTACLVTAVRRLRRQITVRLLHSVAVQSAPARASFAHRSAQLIIQVTAPDEQPGVLCVVLIGALNHYTYEGLLETVKAYYEKGNRYLVLNLRQTTELKLSGLFALINIARLYHGHPLLDPTEGWLVLGQAAAECTPELTKHVKLLAPSSAAEAALRSIRYGEFFQRHADLPSALAAFIGDSHLGEMS
ncbi:hypothetical protein GC175_17500 [bacterium]|nr:hypothetical protein [bacterium]